MVNVIVNSKVKQIIENVELQGNYVYQNDIIARDAKTNNRVKYSLYFIIFFR